MEAELWLEIRRLFHREHLARKAIARRLGVDVKTVRRALRSKEPPGTAARGRRASILDPFKARIQALIEEHPDLSAVRILEEIRKEGYPGQITVLRVYVAGLREKKRTAYLKLAFAPGEAAQVDWGHCGTIEESGHVRRLSVFAMVLCHSRMLSVTFTFSQSLDDLLRGHQVAFEAFGGCPSRVIYDNMRTVVLSRAEDRVRFHPRFLDFAAHYLIKPVACRPGQPQEKGRVERAVGYIKRNFLAGRSFRGLADLNTQARRWLDEVANVRLHGTTHKRPVDLFEQEKRLLGPLPARPYDTRILRPVLVSPDARVAFETNTYTTPPDVVGKRLVLRASEREVRVYHGDREVARHVRCLGRHEDVVDPAHVRAVLERKTRATASALLARFLFLGPTAKAYVEGLVERQLQLGVHVKRLVGLLDLYGKHEMTQALERALGYGAFGHHYVQHLLLEARRKEDRPPPAPLLFPDKPEIEALTLPETDLGRYDRLLVDDTEQSEA